MATTRTLDQLAEEKEQELLLIRQQQTQAAHETIKGKTRHIISINLFLSVYLCEYLYMLKINCSLQYVRGLLLFLNVVSHKLNSIVYFVLHTNIEVKKTIRFVRV